MNLHEDPKFAGILADLKRIGDELLESGKLFQLTGSEESRVLIEFGMYGEGKESEPSILIKVTSPEEIDFDFDEEELEELEDYVIARLEDASLEWADELKESLGDDRLIILLINGEEY
jgi:hypothetical protein